MSQCECSLMDDKIINLVADHEGFRSMQYLCTAGDWTIGYGYNLNVNPLNLSVEKIQQLKTHGIGKVEARKYLVLMLEKCERELSGKLAWWSKLNLARQAVLLDMAYNVGIVGLLGFKKMLAALERGDYAKAANEMLESKWAKQVKTRATHLVQIMITGKL